VTTPAINRALAAVDHAADAVHQAKTHREGHQPQAEIDLEVCWISLRDIRSILIQHQETP
jgi:hypothetical protein